jgi:hypothetical protein
LTEALEHDLRGVDAELALDLLDHRVGVLEVPSAGPKAAHRGEGHENRRVLGEGPEAEVVPTVLGEVAVGPVQADVKGYALLLT